MKVLLILKISRGKVTNFSEVTKFFPDFFFPDKISTRPNVNHVEQMRVST